MTEQTAERLTKKAMALARQIIDARLRADGFHAIQSRTMLPGDIVITARFGLQSVSTTVCCLVRHGDQWGADVDHLKHAIDRAHDELVSAVLRWTLRRPAE